MLNFWGNSCKNIIDYHNKFMIIFKNMIIECPQCNKKAKLNEELYKDKILRIRCRNCLHIWELDLSTEGKKEEPISPPQKEVTITDKSNLSAEIQEAQRIARLIISEIKLYNQDLCHKLKKKEEILESLKEDLTLGRQHYKQRISPKLPPTPDYFQEAINTILLADKE
jgi:hypothetical protein